MGRHYGWCGAAFMYTKSWSWSKEILRFHLQYWSSSWESQPWILDYHDTRARYLNRHIQLQAQIAHREDLCDRRLLIQCSCRRDRPTSCHDMLETTPHCSSYTGRHHRTTHELDWRHEDTHDALDHPGGHVLMRSEDMLHWTTARCPVTRDQAFTGVVTGAQPTAVQRNTTDCVSSIISTIYYCPHSLHHLGAQPNSAWPSLLVSKMSTSESWRVNKHTTRCIKPGGAYVAFSSWGLQNREYGHTVGSLDDTLPITTIITWI